MNPPVTMNEKISFKHDLSDAEEITVVSRLAKQRKEAAFEYHKGNRAELAEKEEREFEILKEFLPDQLSESKIDELILEAIKESQAGTLKDMGKVMKIVAPQIKGRADGKLVSQMVQKRLSVS